MTTYFKSYLKCQLPPLLEVEPKEVVRDLRSALTREDEHGIAGDRHRKVTARWRNVAGLVHLERLEGIRTGPRNELLTEANSFPKITSI